MKRALLAFLTFGVVLAAVAGFAASLNLGTPSTIGADSATVAACDDVSVSWGTPSYSGGVYKITTVKVTEDLTDGATNNCLNKAVKVTVGGQEATGTMSAAGDSSDMTISGGGVDAELVTNVAVVVG